MDPSTGTTLRGLWSYIIRVFGVTRLSSLTPTLSILALASVFFVIALGAAAAVNGSLATTSMISGGFLGVGFLGRIHVLADGALVVGGYHIEAAGNMARRAIPTAAASAMPVARAAARRVSHA